MLGLTSGIHIAILVLVIGILRHFGLGHAAQHRLIRSGFTIGAVFAAVVLAHTTQFWLLAAMLYARGALGAAEDVIYFRMVINTALGHGDITLAPEHRIFAAMGAVTGLLSFGLSTAFLVGILSRIIADSEVDT